MSLAELFYARQRVRRRWWPSRQRGPMRRPLVFEPLEPRLLLSADPTLSGVLLLEPVLVPETAPPIVMSLEPTASLIQAAPINVDNLVEVSFSGLVLNRATNTFDTQVTIANTSEETLLAPMRLLVTGIDPEGVTLANQSGQTEAGVPFVDVTLPQGELASGGQIDNVFLEFANPERVRFTFATDVEAVVEQGDTQAPLIAAALVHDTGPDPADGLTFDPSIGGTVTDASAITAFQAGLDDASSAEFADVLGQLESDGSFTLDQAALEIVNGGPLADGTHVLHLQASDVAGNTSPLLTVQFALDTTAPAAPAFDLAPPSDTAPTGDQQTTLATVDLTGQTEAGSQVALAETGGAATADATGAFTFSGVALAPGPNLFTAHATDPAGNEAEFSRTITRLPEGADEEPPAIAVALADDTGTSAGDRSTRNPAIAGQITDASALVAVVAGFDDAPQGSFSEILGDLQADGTFVLSRPRLEQINGGVLGDGAHTFHVRAQDAIGNESPIVDVAFVLDTAAPALVVQSPTDGATVSPGAELAGTVDGTGSAVASLLYMLGALPPIAVAVGPSGDFRQPLALDALSEGGYGLVVEATDIAGNTTIASLDVILDVPFTITTHAPLDGMEAVGVMARPRIDFSKPVDPATVTATSLFAAVGDETLPARIVVSNGGRLAWLYATGGLPGGSEVEVTVNGDLIHALDGEALDASGDGTPGGVLSFTFTTASTVALAGTTLSGRVLDVGPDFLPLTSDDVEPGPDGEIGTADDVFLRPVAGVPVFLLGREGDVILTGADGRFQFDAVPAGDVKVVIDGQQVAGPPGFTFPQVILDTGMDAATANDLGAVYLPRLGADVYAGVDAAQETVLTLAPGGAFGLTDEQRQQFTLTIAPDSLLSADGQRVASGEVGLGVVPVDVLAPLLPAGLPEPVMAFTIQTRGFTDFAEPAQLTLPNLSGAAPGTEFSLLTFDHTTRQLVNDGTLVVSSAPGAPLIATLGASATPTALSLGDVLKTFAGGITFACFHLVVPTVSPVGPPCNPTIAPTVDIDPIVAFGPRPLPSRFFTSDAGSFQWIFENRAEPIDPSLDPCSDVNAMATPLVVKIEIDGPAGQFLEGLEPQTFELLPREVNIIDVTVKDLSAQRKTLDADQLYAAQVHVTGFKKTAPDVLLIDQKLAIGRFQAVVDPDGTKAVFLKTLADRDTDGGFARAKRVDYHLPANVFTTIEGLGDFNLGVDGPLAGEGSTEWFFDPTSAASAPFIASGRITIDEKPLPGIVNLSGTAVAPTHISPNRSGFEDALRQFTSEPQHFNGAPGVPQASQPFKDFFHDAILFFTGGVPGPKREELISAAGQALVDAVRADFAPANLGYIVDENGGDVEIKWQPFVLSENGQPIYGKADVIDANRGEIEEVFKNSALPDVAKEFALAESLNLSPMNSIKAAMNIQERWGGSSSFSSFVANTVSHELGHTFGLNESYLKVGGGGGTLPPGMIMGIGSSLDPDLRFADVQMDQLRAAIGLAPDEPGGLHAAVESYRKNFHLPNNVVGLPNNRENSQEPPAVPVLGLSIGADDLFDGESFDAGIVLADGVGGQSVLNTLTLTNSGLAPLTIGALTLGGEASGFSLVGPSPTGITLAIGESTAMNLLFDPAVAGAAVDTLIITTTSPVNSPFTLALEAEGLTTAGRIAVSLAPDTFTGVGQNNVGGLELSAPPRAIDDFLTIRNVGGGALIITDISAPLGAGQFRVSGLPPAFGPASPLVLAPNEALTLGLVFDATALGLQRGRIDIASDDPLTPIFRQAIVGTGLLDMGSALDYGHDFVAVEQPQLPNDPVVRTVSDARGNWTFYLTAGQSFHDAIFDPVSGLIAHGFGVTAPAGIATHVLTPVFGASTAPDRDGDGLPGDVEFAVGTSDANVDSDGDGVDDFAKLRAGLAPTIVAIKPADGASVSEGLQRVSVRFSESLAPASVTADTFRVLTGGQTVTPLGIDLLDGGRLVQLRFAGLAVGDYQLVIDADAVTDLAGHPLGVVDVTSGFTVAAVQATKRWINPAGGVWDDPDNWEGGTLPGPTDKVLIDVPAEVTVVHRTGTTVIESLLSREAFEVVGGTLRVASTIEVDNTFTVGTSTGAATLADATVLPGAGGEGLVISDTGVLDDVTLVADATIADGSEMQARNGLTLDGARVTLESGAAAATVFFLNTQTLGGTGDLFFGGTSDQGEILTGGLLTIGPGVTIRGSQSGVVSGFDESVPSLALQGAILAETAGETIEVSETTNWTNAGVVGATNGARLTMDGIVRFEGAGTFKASGGEVLLVGTLDNTGKTLALTAATGSLVTAGPAQIVGGRLVFSGGATLDVGPVTLDGVTLASDLVIEGRPFGSRPGRVTVENGLTLEDAVITLSDNVLFGQPDLSFDGTQTLSGTGGIVFSGSFSNGVVGVADFTSGDTLTIAPGITVRASGDGDLDGIINQGVIIAESDSELSLLSAVNQGTLQGLSGSTLDLRDFTNAGTVVVAGIAHMSSGDYVQTAGQTELQGTLTGNVDIRGGTLSGADSPFAGAISGNLRNAGQITLGTAADPTGTLSVGGAFEQTTAGALNVDLGGATTTAFDRLLITGTATLGGTLNVHLVGGFVPAVGDTFDILTFVSRTGNFASVTGLSLPDGNTLQFTAEATGIRLITVSGPVLDTLPPAILEIDPADGASEPEGLQVVQVRFSEALDPATVTASTFRVVRAGQTQAALGVDLLDQGSLVRLRFAGLAAGDYQIVIDADAVADLAGNALGGPDVTSDFSLVGEQVTWINPAGGFWDDPANWSGGALPGPGDNVVIDVPGDVTITHRTGTTVINRLISHESLALTGGTLDVATTLQVDGSFTLAFSTTGTTLRHATVLPGAGGQDVLITSSATLDGVTLAADLTVASLGTADVRNGLTLDGARLTLASDGSPTMLFFHDDQTLGGTGEVFFGGSGNGNAVDVDSGELTIGPDITIRGSQGGSVGHSFGNESIVLAGTVLAETAGKTIVVDGNSWVNSGLVRATNGGRLELDGTFTLEGGGTFSASGGAVVLVGTLDNTGRTLAITAATGSLQVDGGTIRGGRIETTGGALLVAQVAMTLDGVTLGSNFSLQDGGTVAVTNGLTLDHVTVTLLDGTVPFTGPRIRFDGTQALGGTGDIVFGGTGDAGSVVAGSGATLTIGSGITIHGPRGGSVGVLGSLVNEGTISAQVNAIEINVSGSSVTNKGTVQAMNGGRILLSGGPFTNTGGVTASAGSIVRLFSGTYLQTAGETSLAGGTLTASTVSIQGGVLSGFGTVSGNLINAALVDIGAPTGTLQVTGTYQQTVAGTLKVGLGGAGAGQFDRLQITGAATLGGTLDVSLVGGFLPAVGNTFEILTFASRTGDFGAITGLTLPDGHTLQESPEATRVRLVTV